MDDCAYHAIKILAYSVLGAYLGYAAGGLVVSYLEGAKADLYERAYQDALRDFTDSFAREDND